MDVGRWSLPSQDFSRVVEDEHVLNHELAVAPRDIETHRTVPTYILVYILGVFRAGALLPQIYIFWRTVPLAISGFPPQNWHAKSLSMHVI